MLSIEESVPAELINNLKRGGYSLHVKGLAGTGKTTLALEIARKMSQVGTAIFLSARVSPVQLIIQFPWIKEFLNEQNILDAKKTYISSEVPRSVLFEYTDQPEFLRSLNARIHGAVKRPVTVIIDSWDALKSNLNIPGENNILESILLELGEKTASNMLFITETQGSSKLDYLTDGVIRLEREIVEGRLIRKIYLEKIRGGLIGQPYYLFTLKEGRFNYFEPKYFPGITIQVQQEDSLKGKELISTGIRAFDHILGGGLRKGAFNVIEIMRRTGTEYLYIISSILESFSQHNFPAFIVSTPISSFRLTENYALLPIRLENNGKHKPEFREKTYYFQFGELSENPKWNEIIVGSEDIKKFYEIFRETITRTINKLCAETFFWFLGVETMELFYGAESFVKILGRIVSELGAINGIGIALAKQGVKSMKTLINIASTHFIMDNIGTPIIYGVSPRTKVHALVTAKLNHANILSLVIIE
ncbi:MAG: gas vesicle protein GvpD P-loop domain-containing protein [Candidatus Jordarchaeum sp.]|uniref:gas vesicle protein GvpD P-loop domain-containing protein n=1 Tax=Candidatus Jordarchaeum sp. TaxID=2823881 RepID=UPI00404B039E